MYSDSTDNVYNYETRHFKKLSSKLHLLPSVYRKLIAVSYAIVINKTNEANNKPY